MSNKAQAVTYDFFIAMSIFFIILVIIFSYWAYSMKEIEEMKIKQEAFDNLVKASNVWFKEGYPIYWNAENVVEIGMLNEGRINMTKVEIIQSMGYQKFLSLLNIGMYNVFYNLTWGTASIEFGKKPQSAKNVYRLERIGVLGNHPVKIETIIWD